MISPNPSLEPDWDEDNINHIAKHGLRPEQVEEVYYGEGPYPTLTLKNKRKRGRLTEYRYRLWGIDVSGTFIEAIIAPYPEYGLWRCVTAFPMSPATPKSLFKENQQMSKLPEKIRKKLKKEARSWDTSIAKEQPEEVQKLLDQAEPFVASRPPRQPVSLRIDPFDLSMAKRIARRKGIPFTQLMSMWLHEKIEQEKGQTSL